MQLPTGGGICDGGQQQQLQQLQDGHILEKFAPRRSTWGILEKFGCGGGAHEAFWRNFGWGRGTWGILEKFGGGGGAHGAFWRNLGMGEGHMRHFGELWEWGEGHMGHFGEIWGGGGAHGAFWIIFWRLDGSSSWRVEARA